MGISFNCINCNYHTNYIYMHSGFIYRNVKMKIDKIENQAAVNELTVNVDTRELLQAVYKKINWYFADELKYYDEQYEVKKYKDLESDINCCLGELETIFDMITEREDE